MPKRRLRLAVDVGGTFTDVTLHDPGNGRILSAKVLTTPANRAVGVMAGIRAALADYGATPDDVREVIHGSTTGTNALIERKGAKVGFLTTEGFRDVLEIGRIQRPMAGLYDINVDRPPPLVPRHLCLTARERVDAQGRVLLALDPESVRRAAETFKAEGVEAVAICFLFSFLNPAHEEAAADLLAALLPGVPISISSRLSPEYREYERASTAVINAYLAPVMAAYLDDLARRIAAELGAARLFVIQANGGSSSVATAREKAVTTVNSGPAGGVVAAGFYGRVMDRDKLVSVDTGGTSFDIGLVEGGVPNVTTEGAFQDLPVKIPIIDLHIIGAGGGSIAWLDPGGALNVGPHSAGAEPGPACYGRGGIEATVTDANLVLGRLNPAYFNGGRMTLDVDAARRAVGRIALALALDLEEAALGIVKVVNANMIKGIATVTIQRGIDVRAFSLLSFGGAGGAHAVDIARELGMTEAIVPPMPGTFSAVGLLVTDMRHDYVTALGNVTVAAADVAAIERAYRVMEERGRAELASHGFAPRAIRLDRFADLKVKGQTYELSLPLPKRGRFDRASLAALIARFAAVYRERYAFFFEGEPIEIVNVRVYAFGRNPPLALPTARARRNARAVRKATRPVYFERRGFIRSAIYERSELPPGAVVRGPAVIEEETSATVLPPGASATVAADRGLFIPLKRRR
jgi:N-methylhydantoinase A